jgi:hypothetical protein
MPYLFLYLHILLEDNIRFGRGTPCFRRRARCFGRGTPLLGREAPLFGCAMPCFGREHLDFGEHPQLSEKAIKASHFQTLFDGLIIEAYY